MAIPETVTSLASQYFLNPFGLLAALGLVPLIIFYLIKPKPEEQIMPSMMFFMKRQSEGRVSHAMRTLMRNLLLLLHILFVISLAAAVAQPQISGIQKPDNSVVVFDASASMANDMESAKDFVGNNLGEQNTLVIADRTVSVPLEDASGSQVRRYLQNLEPKDVETDIAAGLEVAREYEGQVVVASDMDQTVNTRQAAPIAEEIQQNRDVKVLQETQKNSWGIIDVEPGTENSSIDIKNFQEESAEIAVTTNEGGRRINVESGAVETITVAMKNGTNTIELEEDSSTVDNKAYISVPEEREFELMYIADEENPYIAKAVELIPFTTYKSAIPPVNQDLDADIYIVGETDRILENTADEIENQVQNGAGLVLFAQPELRDKGFESAPEIGQKRNVSAEILNPVRANIGETSAYSIQDSSFESLSNPNEVVLRKDYGDGEVVVYNLNDADFRFDFLYPIFWKNIFSDLTERPSINQLNTQTGDTIEGSEITKPNGETVEGPITATKAGFYETSRTTYAVNLESEAESEVDEIQVESSQATQEDSKQNFQHLAALLLALIAALELLYLARIGELT